MLKNELTHCTQKLGEKVAEVVASRRRFPFLSMATLLYGGSLLYGAVLRGRNALYQHQVLIARRIDRPVISIGNITAGGTGKTPMAVHLARMLGSLGLKVLIVSRGYKSLSEKVGAVVSDGQTLCCDARMAGDEPCLMARLLGHVPVMVGQNRYATAQEGIQRFDPDVIVLDDAFQHRALARDVNIVLMDANEPVGNGFLLPRGPLREPLSSLERADAIVFTRGWSVPQDRQPRLVPWIRRKPIFHCRHASVLRGVVPAGQPLGVIDASNPQDSLDPTLKGRPVFVFAGLAGNRRFFSDVARLGADVRGTTEFADHHFYNNTEIETLVRQAKINHCDALVTTDKDYVRLSAATILPMDLIVLGVEIDFGDDQDRWHAFIREQLKRHGARLTDRA